MIDHNFVHTMAFSGRLRHVDEQNVANFKLRLSIKSQRLTLMPVVVVNSILFEIIS